MITPRRARRAVEAVADPELPMLTIADLGILRDVRVEEDAVVVTITPTYSGCPAMVEIRADVEAALARAGAARVVVETVLSPAWSTDWMTDAGRAALRSHGIAPPGPRGRWPVEVRLGSTRALVACPRCDSTDTEELSRFGSTSCKSLWRCRSCREPFDRFKDH